MKDNKDINTGRKRLAFSSSLAGHTGLSYMLYLSKQRSKKILSPWITTNIFRLFTLHSLNKISKIQANLKQGHINHITGTPHLYICFHLLFYTLKWMFKDLPCSYFLIVLWIRTVLAQSINLHSIACKVLWNIIL